MKTVQVRRAAGCACLLIGLSGLGHLRAEADGGDAVPAQPSAANTVRVAAAQPKSRLIDWRIGEPAAVLERVDRSLSELEQIIHKAGAVRCDVLAFPEDTLGLGTWEAAHNAMLKDVLPEAVARMLDRLGRAAASHRMFLVLCNDTIEPDGSLRNTAFLLGRDGRELGRYHKVNMPIHELNKKRGDQFPVFPIEHLGGVGLLICYDMVFPEAARCLALGGAEIIFHPTLGGAAIGDADISRAAFRTRAVENFVYLVVAQRGSGSMIVSPQGRILAEADGPDSLAIADIDPFGERAGGDAMNRQRDMRARLFRERHPAAFGILTSTDPPVLGKVPETMTVAEAVEISGRTLTVGEERFRQADSLRQAGKTNDAIAAFSRLRREFRQTWIDRVSQQRLAELGADPAEDQPWISSARERPTTAALREAIGIATHYPGDVGIWRDPRVIFSEDFEEPSLNDLWARWETIAGREDQSFSEDVPPGSAGKHSLLMDRQKGSGPQLYRRLENRAGDWGHERVFARYYVQFDADCGEIHHFGTCLGGNHPPTPWPSVNAGHRTDGAGSFWSGIEPFGSRWVWDYYTYWCEMRGSPPRGQTWGNSFIRDPELKVEKGRWICIEQMIHLNDPDDRNGEQALWIDGQLVSHLGKGFPKGLWTYDKFAPGRGGEGVRWSDERARPERFEVPEGGAAFEGFRWPTIPELNVNYVWLYVYTSKPAGHRIKVWFDDVVVATEYIGPIRK